MPSRPMPTLGTTENSETSNETILRYYLGAPAYVTQEIAKKVFAILQNAPAETLELVTANTDPQTAPILITSISNCSVSLHPITTMPPQGTYFNRTLPSGKIVTISLHPERLKTTAMNQPCFLRNR